MNKLSYQLALVGSYVLGYLVYMMEMEHMSGETKEDYTLRIFNY